MAKRKASSSRWLQRQGKDPYVLSANQQGLRSRAYFKLQQLDEKYRLLKNGQIVLDLGSAPGGWSQYAVSRIGAKPTVYSLDLLEMDPLPGVHFIQGDFLGEAVQAQLIEQLANRRADLVLSDIAPNLSGIREQDEARMLELAEAVYQFAKIWLAPKTGKLVIKLFQGAYTDAWIKRIKPEFESVVRNKPRASRPESSEFYLLACGLRTASILSDIIKK